MTAAAATTAEQISPAEPLVHLLIDREGIVLVEPWVGGELHHSLGDNSTALCTHFLFFHSIVCCLFVFFLFPFPPQLVPTEMELTCRPSLDYHLIVLIILSQIAINVFITVLTDAALISSVLVLRVVILCIAAAANGWFGFPVCQLPAARSTLAKKVNPLSLSLSLFSLLVYGLVWSLILF